MIEIYTFKNKFLLYVNLYSYIFIRNKGFYIFIWKIKRLVFFIYFYIYHIKSKLVSFVVIYFVFRSIVEYIYI